MQLSGCKLLVTDRPIFESQFHTLIQPQQLTKMQSTQKLDLQDMSSPIVSALFGYKAGPEFEGFELQMQLQLMIKGEKISHKNIAYKRVGNFMYKCVEIDSCVCYEKLITAVVTVKYAQNQQRQQIRSVQQLCQMLSRREFAIYNEKTLSVYKRDIIVKEPVYSLYRYSPEGYIWMKCSNLNIALISIHKVELMNWLVKNNDDLKHFQSKTSLANQMTLKKQQSIGIMLSVPKYLQKQEIPCMIKFSLPQCPSFTFKMIKYLYIL